MLGYAWAYAEADSKMRPLAMSALASKEGAAKAGKASGARRRAKAADTWKPKVKVEALRLRNRQNDISQIRLAEEIRYRLDQSGLPSSEIIVRYIRALERAGELPKREKSERERPSRANANAVR